MSLPYRPCVVGVFINPEKKLLVAKRININAWQFPQGGIESHESPSVALLREMMEEIGSAEITIVKEAQKKIYYEFPKDLKAPIAKDFRGQEQYWFLCKFKTGASPDLQKAQGAEPEFSALEWVSVDEVLRRVVDWKRAAYKEGLAELGLGGKP